jgi:Zn-dependent protease with chaperone function
MTFFASGVGQYLSQVLCYSLVTLITLETLLAGWRITANAVQLRFRLAALLIPVLAPFIFLAWSGIRTDTVFREQAAFFDITTWLGQGLFWKLAVWHLAAAGMAVTAGVFIVKEAVPSLRHLLRRRILYPRLGEGTAPALDAAVAEQSRALGIEPPAIYLAAGRTPLAHVSEGRRLIVSEGVLALLDEDELRALVGHELAHLTPRVRWTNRVLLALRWFQCYNPLAFPLYYRVHRDLEKWCDDIGAGLTGKPLVLPSALLKINRALARAGRGRGRTWAGVARLEHEANLSDVRERVRRSLRPGQGAPVPFPDLRLAVAGVMLLATLFFIV